MCGFLVVSGQKGGLEQFQKSLMKIQHRGPDAIHASYRNGIHWGFNRLSIMDLSSNGNQPFIDGPVEVVCNGEIYNYPKLKANIQDGYTFQSSSDCEVLAPLYRKYGFEVMVKMLDAEFACVLYDETTKQIMAADSTVLDATSYREAFSKLTGQFYGGDNLNTAYGQLTFGAKNYALGNQGLFGYNNAID